MMRRYHLADVCTLVRFACVVFLVVWAFWRGSVAGALTAFVLGELMDGLDGSLARKYPYPRDGKYRWWRDGCNGQLPEIYDQVADILLGLAALLYVGLNIHPGLALWIVSVGVAIAVPIQIWRAWRIRLIPNEDDDPLRVGVILVRRMLYLLAIGVVVLAMIIALPTAGYVKLFLVACGVVVAVMAVTAKFDRLQRDKPKK